MKRILELDVLRSFALLGIIWANVMWFSGFAVSPEPPSAVDTSVAFAVKVLVDGKFYSLFSLLFGIGFALALAADPRRYGRRLAALLGLGLAHGVFLWFGDIVSLYAVTGLALLWVRQWPARRLALAAGACLAAPALLGGFLVAASALGRVTTGSGYGPGALLPTFATGSFGQILEANWAFLVDRWYLALLSSRFLRILGMFLLGVALVRAGVLRERAWHARVLRLLWPIALLSNLALAWCGGVAPPRPPTWSGWLIDCLSLIAVPAGCLVYASCGFLLGHRFAWLAPAGRMSLTNYVGQSLAMALLFYGYGLGLWGQVGATGAVVIATSIFAAQVAASAWWLKHFRHGPLEWLVRRACGRPR